VAYGVYAPVHRHRLDRRTHECDEGELAWIKKADLLSLPLWEGDKIFLRLLDADAPFFSLKLRYEGEKLVQAILNGQPLTI
jgi:8-oxo-dGTP diphosphatase